MTEGTQRPRPQPARLHHVAGRRRRQGRPGRYGATDDFGLRAVDETTSTSTTCTPRSCTCSASTTTQLTYRHNGRDDRLTDNAGEVIEQGAGLGFFLAIARGRR